jgi:hypothetical protein
MNKYQEALDFMLDQKAWIDQHEFSEENQNLYVELLQRATPKKVVREEVGKIIHVHCPNCDRVLRHETNPLIVRQVNHRFCSHCGQSLDWSKDNE